MLAGTATKSQFVDARGKCVRYQFSCVKSVCAGTSDDTIESEFF